MLILHVVAILQDERGQPTGQFLDDYFQNKLYQVLKMYDYILLIHQSSNMLRILVSR